MSGIRNFTDAEGDVRHEFRTSPFVEFSQQRGLQENELLQPDRVSDSKVQFFEAHLRRPRV